MAEFSKPEAASRTKAFQASVFQKKDTVSCVNFQGRFIWSYTWNCGKERKFLSDSGIGVQAKLWFILSHDSHLTRVFLACVWCAGSSLDSEGEVAGDGVTAKSFMKKKPVAEPAPEASKFLKGATAVRKWPYLYRREYIKSNIKSRPPNLKDCFLVVCF